MRVKSTLPEYFTYSDIGIMKVELIWNKEFERKDPEATAREALESFGIHEDYIIADARNITYHKEGDIEVFFAPQQIENSKTPVTFIRILCRDANVTCPFEGP